MFIATKRVNDIVLPVTSLMFNIAQIHYSNYCTCMCLLQTFG